MPNYDTAQTVLNTARVRLHDRIETAASVRGSLDDATSAYAQAALNSGWRHLQVFLGNCGFTTLIGDTVIPSLPIVATTDPASQTFISWTACSDGVNVALTSPLLPANLMYPLACWERQSGINAPFPVHPNMENMLDGLPALPKGIMNRRWEWREDAIWLPGAQQHVDLRVRYQKSLADFADGAEIQWFDQPVPILLCSDALAWFVVAECLSGRADPALTSAANEAGEREARKIVNRDVRAKQRVNVRRQPRSGGDGGGCGWY